MSRPNVLYLHSHDTGRYIQPYGHAVDTPHLQGLAEGGVLFRQAFCASPTCSASRACLLTGQSAHANGMVGLAHRGFGLTDYGHHLVRTLASAGFHTALAGVQHEAAQERVGEIGYDEILGPPAEAHVAAARYLARGPEQPFFLSVGFAQTHREFPEPSPQDNPAYCLPPAPLPDTPETRADMARFRTSARQLDRSVGIVLDELAQAGLADNTLVVCTTDHGIAFPAMKCNLTDHGTGIMLMVRGPGGFSGGRACDALVSHIDIYPTLCEVLGIPPPAWLEGVSLMPLIRGEAEEVNAEVFGEVNYHAAYEPMRTVRTRRWRYIRRYDGRVLPVLPNCDDGPSKTLWLAHGWAQRRLRREAFYDVVFDPNQVDNLAERDGWQEVLADLRQRLQAWMQRTGDPLLRGPVPAPAGARVNDPDGVSPREPTRVS